MVSQEKSQHTQIVAFVGGGVQFHLAIPGGYFGVISAFSLAASPIRMGRHQMPITVFISTLARGLSERRRGPPPPCWLERLDKPDTRGPNPLDPRFHLRAAAETRKRIPTLAKPELGWPKGCKFPQWHHLPHLHFPPHPSPPQSSLRKLPAHPL